ncbi:two-component system nitrogen regulation sensor histidine kinase NtrY [Variibacter gotjawalensis]|nr:two-component system nitrogen regulation sensor histidine kinase NtrY [Variibacter gotjawalensis]
MPAPRLGTRFLGPAAITLALLSALVTFLVLTNLTPIAPTHDVVVSVLIANAVAALLLLSIITWEIAKIVQARRHGQAGSRLHVRIVALFSIIAALPAVLVAIVASITLDRGLDQWFSTRTRAIIANSITVAEAYVREHAEMIRSDIVATAFDAGRAKPLFDQDRERFKQFLAAQSQYRGLQIVALFDTNGKILESFGLPDGRQLPLPPKQALEAITTTEPRIALVPDSGEVASVIRLHGYENTYLYVARPLAPKVLEQLRQTQLAVAEYEGLEARRPGVQVAFGLMYTVIALILLLSSAWLGLNFANRLVTPIRRLIGAANLVSTGNLFVQVPVRRSEGDLANLGETFNKMTQELRSQRDDLVSARDTMDSRRRFTEAVLAGASAGVIGLDAAERITILNRSAEKILGKPEAEALNVRLVDLMPELEPLLTAARSGGQRMAQGQLAIARDSRERNLSVRVTTEQAPGEEHGYVVTLDDITDLVMAQRSTAWADIARRIAHEIKNPLTPIQLSAERLKRKYGKVIVEDKAVFEQCTDTIVRQVDDIKRMVDEFSRFARMPKPVMGNDDVADTVRQVVFLQQVANPDIDFEYTIDEDPMLARFDRRLISQGLTNIVKNATEAVAAVPTEELGKGLIKVTVKRDGEDIVIDVIDNGIGLPKENRNRLLEPYVTTREKGTGLGLAIVERILEEHGGRIELNDSPEVAKGGRGAWMRLQFSDSKAAANVAPAQDSKEPQGAQHGG